MAERRIPLAELPEPELEAALRDLGAHLSFPPTPDVAGQVRARLEMERAHPLPARRQRRWLWLAAALMLLLLGGLALIPGVRTAVAEWLGLPGVTIRWVEDAPTPSPVGAPLRLGDSVTLNEAEAAVDFPLLLPAATGFQEPPEVYLLGTGEDTMVSFVYPAGDSLPESEFTGVGALLTQFRGVPERNLIEKGLHGDTGEPATTLAQVDVGGERGFWIAGAPHSVFLVCPEDDECREERYRLAGNVLIWERDGVTLRLESELDLGAALAIAESMRPAH